ncbi:MAG: hypothetical protein ACRDGV_04685 [Candidatus Limnocylindria bacterium]
MRGRNRQRGGGVYGGMRLAGGVLASAVLGVLTGCGPVPPPEPSEQGPIAVERPTGADELVLRLETRGGLLPPLERERQLPSISIYGDGQVLVPAPVDASFPGPAGYGLESFRIGDGLLDEIVAAAVSIGLRGEDRHLPQEGPDFVADAGATTLTLVTGDGRHVTSADALFDAADTDTPARTQLRDFVERLYALRPTRVAPAPYQPDAYRVFVADPDPGFGAELPDAPPVAWPFPEPLAAWGEALPADGLSVDVRCRVMSLAELADAFEFLRAATSATVVVDEADERAIVAWRPLLPDEEGCTSDA